MSSSSGARADRRQTARRRGADIVGGGDGSNKNKYPGGQDPEKSARKQDKLKMARRGSGFDSDGDDGGAEELPDTSRVASHEEPAEDVAGDDNALSPARMKTVADALDLAVGADTSSAAAKDAPVHTFGAPSVTGFLGGACLVSVGTNQRGTTVRLPPGGSVTLGIDFGIMTDDVPAYQCTIGHDGSTWSVTGLDALKPAHVFFSHSLSRTLEPRARVELARGNVLVLDSAGAYAFRLETVNNGDSLDDIMQGVNSTSDAVAQAPPRALDASLAAAAVEPVGTASGGATSGWLADQSAVAREVAAAKAQAAAGRDALLSKYEIALGMCDALEAIPKDKLGKSDITNVIQGLFCDSSMYQKKERKSIHKSQIRVRPKIKKMIREATDKKRLAVAKAELDARLRLEEEARASLEAASAGASREARLRSLRACAKLMDEADDDILSAQPDGNLGKLVAEMRKAQVALITQVDGIYEKTDRGALPNLIVRSLDAVLTKRPPEEVVRGVLRSIAAKKLAPRGNIEASEALEADVSSACRAFPQKTNLVLGPKPSLDGAEGERLRRAHDRRTDAPASQLASVHFCMPFDSASLGGVTDPSRLPVWDGQPRVMINARTVKTIDSMQEHADFLLKGERVAEGKARAARNRQSSAPEEGSSSAAEESSAEEDESKEDESL